MSWTTTSMRNSEILNAPNIFTSFTKKLLMYRVKFNLEKDMSLLDRRRFFKCNERNSFREKRWKKWDLELSDLLSLVLQLPVNFSMRWRFFCVNRINARFSMWWANFCLKRGRNLCWLKKNWYFFVDFQ